MPSLCYVILLFDQPSMFAYIDSFSKSILTRPSVHSPMPASKSPTRYRPAPYPQLGDVNVLRVGSERSSPSLAIDLRSAQSPKGANIMETSQLQSEAEDRHEQGFPKPGGEVATRHENMQEMASNIGVTTKAHRKSRRLPAPPRSIFSRPQEQHPDALYSLPLLTQHSPDNTTRAGPWTDFREEMPSQWEQQSSTQRFGIRQEVTSNAAEGLATSPRLHPAQWSQNQLGPAVVTTTVGSEPVSQVC